MINKGLKAVLSRLIKVVLSVVCKNPDARLRLFLIYRWIIGLQLEATKSVPDLRREEKDCLGGPGATQFRVDAQTKYRVSKHKVSDDFIKLIELIRLNQWLDTWIWKIRRPGRGPCHYFWNSITRIWRTAPPRRAVPIGQASMRCFNNSNLNCNLIFLMHSVWTLQTAVVWKFVQQITLGRLSIWTSTRNVIPFPLDDIDQGCGCCQRLRLNSGRLGFFRSSSCHSNIFFSKWSVEIWSQF